MCRFNSITYRQNLCKCNQARYSRLGFEVKLYSALVISPVRK